MRKEFKRILYARHWQDEQAMRLLSKKQALFLDQLQHLIGDWHDNEDMIAWLIKEQSDTKSGTPLEKRRAEVLFAKAFLLLKTREARFYQQVLLKQKRCNVIMQPLFTRLKRAKTSKA